jgi:ribonuclease Z
MVSVVVLGSGTPNPDPGRAGSAIAVVDDDAWVLVDCGRGATLRAITAELDLTRLAGVLLTHHHSDHVSDLATLAIARWAAGGTTPLLVVAPAGPASTFAARCLDAFDDDCFQRQAAPEAGPRPTTEVQTFAPTDGATAVRDADGWIVRSALVDHHPIEPAVGYRVERAGAVVMVSGDTRVCDGVRTLSAGAHVIVHEALLADRVSLGLLDWNASAESVGALAATIRPQTLALTHLIPAPACAADEQAFRDDVRRGGFDGCTIVARDLLRIEIDVP